MESGWYGPRSPALRVHVHSSTTFGFVKQAHCTHCAMDTVHVTPHLHSQFDIHCYMFVAAQHQNQQWDVYGMLCRHYLQIHVRQTLLLYKLHYAHYAYVSTVYSTAVAATHLQLRTQYRKQSGSLDRAHHLSLLPQTCAHCSQQSSELLQ
jgi:hypothetical protein